MNIRRLIWTSGGRALIGPVQLRMHLAAGARQVARSPDLAPPRPHGPGSQPVDLIMDVHRSRLLSELGSRCVYFFFSSTGTDTTSLAFTVTATSTGPVNSCQATSVYEPGGTSLRVNDPSLAVTA